MKALSLWQPWASLIVLGVKTIETRSWSTKYRGPLAIHAGLHRPPLMWLPPLPPGRAGRDDPRWLVIDTITDPEFKGPQPEGRRIPKRATTPTLFFPHAGPHGRFWDDQAGTSATEQGSALLLPLGAVVATCTLADVVPMWDKLWAARDERAIDQRPYGDFSPGRYAWLLDDIEPVDPPIPAKGKQGLWTWSM